MMLHAAVERVAPEVDRLIAQYEKSGSIVSTTEAALRLFEKEGLAHRMNLHCSHVGAHPSNRDSYGINARDAQNLAADIMSQGWSWKKVADAIAMEIKSGCTTVEQANIELVANSQGL